MLRYRRLTIINKLIIYFKHILNYLFQIKHLVPKASNTQEVLADFQFFIFFIFCDIIQCSIVRNANKKPRYLIYPTFSLSSHLITILLSY